MLNNTKFAFLLVAVSLQHFLPTPAEYKLSMVSQEYLANKAQENAINNTRYSTEQIVKEPVEEENIYDEPVEIFENKLNETIEEEVLEEGFPYLNTAAGKPVILDVDMSTDVDDVCAVRIATAMDTAGIISLEAVMYSVTGDNNVQALRGLLLHDGKPDVKIGTCSIDEPDTSPYWDILATYSDNGGNIDSAVRQYRKILSETSDPVDIVITGYMTNLEYLLKSGPDDISPCDGQTLVKEKVGQLYVVGGSYPEGFSNNFHFTEAARQATDYVNKNWEKPIIFSPGETGGILTCGAWLQTNDIERNDIVTKSLDAFGAINGRAAWDPFCIWICGYGCSEETQIDLERCDLITYPNSNTSTFLPNPSGKHFVVHLRNKDVNYYNSKMDAWLCR